MVDSTFQLAAGIGPTRERRLWQSGIARWRDLPESPTGGLGANHDRALRAGIEEASAALARGDADALAALLPQGEHWRLFDAFGEDATYLDIETSDDVVGFEGISAIGFLNRDGPRLLLAARDLYHFPELARGWPMLVTFNGLSFDVPILRRAFPEWQPPRCHVDLRHVLARLGLHGGLAALCKLYQDHGVDLGNIALVSDAILETFKGAIVLCPPSAIADRWSRRFFDPISSMASGWMGVRARARQRGAELPLIISDHADWAELTQTLKDVGAPKVWVTHGREEALVAYARSIGIDAEALHLAGREEEDES